MMAIVEEVCNEMSIEKGEIIEVQSDYKLTSCYHTHHSYLFARRSRHLAFNMVTLSWPSSFLRIFADIVRSYAERKP